MTNCLLAFMQTFMDHFFPLIKLKKILALSLIGIKKYCFWQFFTFLPLISTPYEMTFTFLLQLSILLYIIWSIGLPITRRLGSLGLFSLLIIPSFIAGLVTLGLSSLFSISMPISGLVFSLFALLTLWIMDNPQKEIVLLVSWRFQARYLVLGYFAFSFYNDLSEWNLLMLAGKLTSLLITYGFATLYLGLKSPFSCTHRLDRFLNSLGCKLRSSELTPHSDDHSYSQSKIYDFKTGKPQETQDEFLDRMLAKISQHGKQSLSLWEKWKLKKIHKSKKQAKNN